MPPLESPRSASTRDRGASLASRASSSARAARGEFAVVHTIVSQRRRQRRNIAVTSLSRIAPNTSARCGPAIVAQKVRERARAGGIVRGVEQDPDSRPA